MQILVLAAAATLTPVSAGDEFLSLDTTFVSQQASIAIESNPQLLIHCLGLPRERKGISDVCLTSQEWKKVFVKVERNEAKKRQLRLMFQAQNRAL